MLNLANIFIAIAEVLIFLSVLIVLLTIIKERCVFSKLVGLEVLSNVLVIAIGVFTLIKHLYFLLDVAIVVSLLIFLGTLAFCSLLEKRGKIND